MELFQGTLTDEQQRLVDGAKNPTTRLILIPAPPGCGKSLVNATIVADTLHREPGSKILMAGASNVCVDSFIPALLEMGVPEDKLLRIYCDGYNDDDIPDQVHAKAIYTRSRKDAFKRIKEFLERDTSNGLFLTIDLAIMMSTYLGSSHGFRQLRLVVIDEI